MKHFTRDYFTITEAAKAISKKEREVARLCREGKFAGAAKEKGQWKIPVAGLFEYINPTEAAEAEEKIMRLITKYGAGPVRHAQWKLSVINSFYKLCEEFFTKGSSRKNAEVFAIEQIKLDISQGNEKVGGFSRTTLYRWQQKKRKDGLEGLIDKRQSRRRPL